MPSVLLSSFINIVEKHNFGDTIQGLKHLQKSGISIKGI